MGVVEVRARQVSRSRGDAIRVQPVEVELPPRPAWKQSPHSRAREQPCAPPPEREAKGSLAPARRERTQDSARVPIAPGWANALPLGMPSSEHLSAESYAEQLSALTSARQLVEEFKSREDRFSGLSEGSTSRRFGGERAGEPLTIGVKELAPNSSAQLVVSIDYVGVWEAEISLKVWGFGGGLFPLLSVLHEADLIADFIPRAQGLPYLEQVAKPRQFANNDWVYHVFVTPWGPFPGADDIHSMLFFDLFDEPEGAILIFGKSPPLNTKVFRGWELPPVKSWRRVRNLLLGATTLVRPSSRGVFTIDPPTKCPSRCASPNCTYRVHPNLSIGGGSHCCQRCALNPGRHGPRCLRLVHEGSPPTEWATAQHGCVDVEGYFRLKLPIPRWLIPNSLLRWAVPILCRLIYPIFLHLNESFHTFPFAKRVADDERGFYRAIADRLSHVSTQFCNPLMQSTRGLDAVTS